MIRRQKNVVGRKMRGGDEGRAGCREGRETGVAGRGKGRENGENRDGRWESGLEMARGDRRERAADRVGRKKRSGPATDMTRVTKGRKVVEGMVRQ